MSAFLYPTVTLSPFTGDHFLQPLSSYLVSDTKPIHYPIHIRSLAGSTDTDSEIFRGLWPEPSLIHFQSTAKTLRNYCSSGSASGAADMIAAAVWSMALAYSLPRRLPIVHVYVENSYLGGTTVPDPLIGAFHLRTKHVFDHLFVVNKNFERNGLINQSVYTSFLPYCLLQTPRRNPSASKRTIFYSGPTNRTVVNIAFDG